MMIALYWLSGYYNNAFFKSRLDEVVNTAYVTLIGSIIIFFAVLINDGIPERLQNYELMSAMWALLFIPVYLGRFSLTYSVTKKSKSRRNCIQHHYHRCYSQRYKDGYKSRKATPRQWL
jgi:hypothetical protein